jgi:hypothetical protein
LQIVFIRGRKILDPVLIADEYLDSRLRSSEPGVICEMDFEKAYDHVSWDFLLHMLRRCGLDSSLHIFCTVLSLVNGTPTGFFSSSRGLRQGDPLSPSLFVFVMEALSGRISAAVSGELLDGFSVGNVVFSHLLFADDTLIFYGAFSAHLCKSPRALFAFKRRLGKGDT